jgi:WD40 repeat protein
VLSLVKLQHRGANAVLNILSSFGFRHSSFLWVILAALFHPAAAAAQGSFPGGEPIEYSTTPQGLPDEELQARDFDFSPDGKLLVAGYGRWTTTGVVRVYEIATKKLLQSFALPKGATAVDYSADGRWLCASCWDHNVYVWDAASYAEAAVILGGTKAVRATFSPDSKWLGVASEAGELKLWDTTTWQEAKVFQGDLFRFQHLAFSPDSKLLVAAGGSFENQRFGRALLFEVESGKQRYVMNAGGQPIGGVAYAPDGQTIATGGFDAVVRIWDAATGKERMAMNDPLGGGAIDSEEADNVIRGSCFCGGGELRGHQDCAHVALPLLRVPQSHRRRLCDLGTR